MDSRTAYLVLARSTFQAVEQSLKDGPWGSEHPVAYLQRVTEELKVARAKLEAGEAASLTSIAEAVKLTSWVNLIREQRKALLVATQAVAAANDISPLTLEERGEYIDQMASRYHRFLGGRGDSPVDSGLDRSGG